jgi:hypothetical protein
LAEHDIAWNISRKASAKKKAKSCLPLAASKSVLVAIEWRVRFIIGPVTTRCRLSAEILLESSFAA